MKLISRKSATSVPATTAEITTDEILDLMSEEGLSLEDDKLLIAYRKCTLVLADDAGLLELAHRSLENTVAHRISDTFDESETAKLLKQAYENDADVDRTKLLAAMQLDREGLDTLKNPGQAYDFIMLSGTISRSDTIRQIAKLAQIDREEHEQLKNMRNVGKIQSVQTPLPRWRAPEGTVRS
tara:strand:- start:509 stop:1057 length:549 start_codon:yes stop_codon:yes gene_type:complete